jgi:ABC-type transport system involved in cytochrome bd biosynthesis fused ATPase/permease subunit
MIRASILLIEILCNISIITCIQDLLKTDLITSIKDIIVYLLCAVVSRLISQVIQKKIVKRKRKGYAKTVNKR